MLTPEEKIASAGHLFDALLEEGSDGVLIVRYDATVAYANRQAEALLGFADGELHAAVFSSLLANEVRAEGMKRLHTFFHDKKGFERYETAMAAKDGRTIFVEMTVLATVFGEVPAQYVLVRDIGTHRRLDAEILENSRRYKDLLDNAHDLIFNASAGGKFLYVNQAWEEVLGYTQGDLVSKTLADILHPDGRIQGEQLLQRVFSGELIPLLTLAFIAKTGEKVFLEGDIHAHIVNGQLVSTWGIFHDITKKLTDARRVRELASIVDQSFEAIIITDVQGVIQYVNASWERLNGWLAAEIIGKVTPRIIKSGAQDAAFYERFWKTLLEGKITEASVTNKRKDGTLYQAEIVAMPLKDVSGVITGFAGFQHDVTARNQAQEQLLKEKEFSENVIENANAVIIILDPAGLMTGFNRKAEEITGYTKAEMTGKNIFETLVPRETYPDVWAVFARMQEGGALIKSYENPILIKGGGERIIAWTNSEIKKDGKTIAIISFGVDVTDRRRMEHELLEKNNDLEQFKNLMVGRELKMIELKKEIDRLTHSTNEHAEEAINQK